MHAPLIVTAAILRRDGYILACRRPAGSRQGGFWELPGGKLEGDEDPRLGLARELREELGIEADIGRPYEVITHRYDFATVLLLVFEASVSAGEPAALHHDEIRWVAPRDLAVLPFLPADRELIGRLAREEFRSEK
jgi:8-oxo-dGTP diphosphatase